MTPYLINNLYSMTISHDLLFLGHDLITLDRQVNDLWEVAAATAGGGGRGRPPEVDDLMTSF